MTSAEKLQATYADYDALEKAISLLQWDRQVLMPSGGAEARTAHVGRLTRMRHEILVSDELRRTLEDAEREADTPIQHATVRELKREVDTESKLPTELVERKAKVSSDAYEVWKRAKAEDDFNSLAPYLEQLFDIARETAELLGYQDHIYDPLIDLYEQGATYRDARAMFDAIKGPIVSLVQEIKDKQGDDRFLEGDWDKQKLRAFAERTTKKIGYDYDRGRLDVAPNAFCMNLASGDVRMTTRASEYIKGIVSSSLHEMGHGLYEQGSPPEFDRTPLAGGISLAVHESQSRLWENIIGRSKPFWEHFLPDLQSTFPQLANVGLNDFYRAVNNVKPEFIRVGADELTYNLHILVRFELEVEILTNQVRIKDLPDAWNAKYQEYLGITSPSMSLGAIQDVHWTRGYVGYFPTYSMGNLIGGQIWRTLQGDIPNTDELVRKGDFAPILGWLQEKIYRKARLHPPRELVEQVTGRAMEPGDWLEYAQDKYGS